MKLKLCALHESPNSGILWELTELWGLTILIPSFSRTALATAAIAEVQDPGLPDTLPVLQLFSALLPVLQLASVAAPAMIIDLSWNIFSRYGKACCPIDAAVDNTVLLSLLFSLSLGLPKFIRKYRKWMELVIFVRSV